MKAPWLKEKGDRHVCVVRARGRRSGMDDPVRVDRLVGPAVWGDDRSPAVAGPRVGGIGAARVLGIRRPGPGAAHIYPSRNGCRSAAFDRCGSWIAVVMRRVLGIVVGAGARFWHVRGVPAAIQRRTRASSDVRRMAPSDLGNRSPGRHRAGWAHETAYEGALEGGPRCCELMTRPS